MASKHLPTVHVGKSSPKASQKQSKMRSMLAETRELVRTYNSSVEKDDQFYHKFFRYVEAVLREFLKSEDRLQEEIVRIFHESVYMFENEGNQLCDMHSHNDSEPVCKRILHNCLQEQYTAILVEKNKVNTEVSIFNSKILVLKQQFSEQIRLQEIKYSNGIEKVRREERQKFQNKRKPKNGNGHHLEKSQQRFSLKPLALSSSFTPEDRGRITGKPGFSKFTKMAIESEQRKESLSIDSIELGMGRVEEAEEQESSKVISVKRQRYNLLS